MGEIRAKESTCSSSYHSCISPALLLPGTQFVGKTGIPHWFLSHVVGTQERVDTDSLTIYFISLPAAKASKCNKEGGKQVQNTT